MNAEDLVAVSEERPVVFPNLMGELSTTSGVKVLAHRREVKLVNKSDRFQLFDEVSHSDVFIPPEVTVIYPWDTQVGWAESEIVRDDGSAAFAHVLPLGSCVGSQCSYSEISPVVKHTVVGKDAPVAICSVSGSASGSGEGSFSGHKTATFNLDSSVREFDHIDWFNQASSLGLVSYVFSVKLTLGAIMYTSCTLCSPSVDITFGAGAGATSTHLEQSISLGKQQQNKWYDVSSNETFDVVYGSTDLTVDVDAGGTYKGGTAGLKWNLSVCLDGIKYL